LVSELFFLAGRDTHVESALEAASYYTNLLMQS